MNRKNYFSVKFIFALAFITILIFSCKDDEPIEKGKGQLRLCVVPDTENSLKSVNEVLSSIIISIDKLDGTHLVSLQKIALQKFEGIYVTEPLAIEAGSYKLTYFAVHDASNQIKYLSPVAGSALASLVKHPLSIDFTIVKNQVCTLIPEVLSTNGTVPGDFGFYSIKFNIIKTISLFAYAFNEINSNFDLSSAVLTISNGTTNIMSVDLQAKANIIAIPLENESYVFTVSKANYVSYVDTFSKSELESISAPLVCKLGVLPANGLIAYYPLNGNANDLSGSGLNGTISGTVTPAADRFGNSSGALYFDGLNSFITLPSTFDIPSRTVNFWFNTNNPVSIQVLYVSDNPNLTYGFMGFSTVYSSSTSKYNLSFSEGAVNSRQFQIEPNTWIMATMTITPTTVKYYINSSLVATVAFDDGTSNQGLEKTFIGTSRAANNSYYKGYIDDVRIYNRAITDSEVSALYSK